MPNRQPTLLIFHFGRICQPTPVNPGIREAAALKHAFVDILRLSNKFNMEFSPEFWKPSFLEETVGDTMGFLPSLPDPFPEMGEEVLQVLWDFSP